MGARPRARLVTRRVHARLLRRRGARPAQRPDRLPARCLSLPRTPAAVARGVPGRGTSGPGPRRGPEHGAPRPCRRHRDRTAVASTALSPGRVQTAGHPSPGAAARLENARAAVGLCVARGVAATTGERTGRANGAGRPRRHAPGRPGRHARRDAEEGRRAPRPAHARTGRRPRDRAGRSAEAPRAPSSPCPRRAGRAARPRAGGGTGVPRAARAPERTLPAGRPHPPVDRHAPPPARPTPSELPLWQVPCLPGNRLSIPDLSTFCRPRQVRVPAAEAGPPGTGDDAGTEKGT